MKEIAERLYSLRNKNLQLKTDSLHFGADICDTMVEQNKLMRSLKAIIRQSDEKNERQIAPVIEALKTLEERIANSADAADARTEKKLEEIFSHLDDAGKAYSKGLCERLDRTVGAYDALLKKGHENLEFWSLSKKMIVFILTMLLLFQLSLNYKMKNELQGLHTQVSMIHSLYKGDTKYWFDPDNQMTYVETLKKELTYPMAWGNSPIRNFKKWKKAARAKVLECMMTPPKAAAAWDMEVLGEEQRDGYKAQKIAFNINAYSRITAYLLIPDGKGPFPTVNALHDHGAHLFIGKEKMIRPFFTPEEQDSPTKQVLCQEILDDADAWARQLYDNQYVGDYLAKHGYVVFSADAPMWGERGRKEGVDRNKYDLIAGNMMMLGRDLSAFMTYDDIASTEFLASLPMVDAKRIGCVGCSMGAYRSWMLSALSDRIKAGASICWMITTDAQLTRRFGRKENGGFANCIPGLRQYLDYPHIASLACPKPMLFINGTKDKLFPVPGVKDAFAEMHKVWKSQGADNLLDTELWEIPHSCGLKAQEKILEFLDRNLK